MFIGDNEGNLFDTYVIKTGSEDSQKKLKSVEYFSTLEEQIHYICEEIIAVKDEYNPDYWCFESLSFGSVGNATRNLAMLLGAIKERLLTSGVEVNKILTFTPQAVKKYARSLLPEDKQHEIQKGKGKPNLVKMDKKMVVKAVTGVLPEEYWQGYKFSGENAGLDDICDAYVLLQLAKEKVNE